MQEDTDAPLSSEEFRYLLANHRLNEAIARLERDRARAEAKHGKASFEVAMVHHSLATASMGDPKTAIKHLRKALECAPKNREERKSLISILNDLATQLERDGKPELAEKTLLLALEQRESFYGKDHAGYGFGLAWYAEFLARRGSPQADEVALAALNNLAQHGHPRGAEVLVLLARLQIRRGIESPFSTMTLDAALWDLVGEAMSHGAEDFDPETVLESVASFLSIPAEKMAPQARGRGHALTFGVRYAQFVKHYSAMRAFASLLRDRMMQEGDASGEQWATMELSFAVEKEGDLIAAEALLKEGLRLASALEDQRPRVHALRQLGTFHAHRRNHAEAERVLRSALLEALLLDNPDEIAKTRVGLGLQVQHQGQLEEARGLLVEAIAVLDPASRDAFTARCHLDAIESGKGCGCGDREQATAQTIEAMMRADLPEGLLDRIEFTDDKPQVHLAREPSAEEQEMVSRAWNQAMTRVRQRAG